MFQLSQTVLGKINQSIHQQTVSYFFYRGVNYIIYTTSDDILILDIDLNLISTLQFGDGVPTRSSYISSSEKRITGVIGSDNGLILAWKENLLVVWKCKPGNVEGKENEEELHWKVLTVLSTGGEIDCLAYEQDLVAITMTQGFEIWRTDMQADVNVWDRVWTWKHKSLKDKGIKWLGLSKGMSHLSYLEEESKFVHIMSLDKRGVPFGQVQRLHHTRIVDRVIWRRPKDPSADPFLYTITTDDVVRLWSPVIDDPMWFQMVWSLGMRQYGIGGIAGRKTVSTTESSSSTSLPCFIVDYPIIRSMSSDTKISSKPVLNGGKWKAGVEDELEEVICWCEEDGSLWKATLPEMERKPPTLLRIRKAARYGQLKRVTPDVRWNVLPAGKDGQLKVLVNSRTSLSILDLGLRSNSNTKLGSAFELSVHQTLSSGVTSATSLNLDQPISYLARTPNGRGLLAVGTNGQNTVWTIGTRAEGTKAMGRLTGRGQWSMGSEKEGNVAASAIFAGGRGLVRATDDRITLHHVNSDGTVTSGIDLPSFHAGDNIQVIIATSDVDDGVTARDTRTQQTYIIAACMDAVVYVWLVEGAGTSVIGPEGYIPTARLMSRYALGGASSALPALVLPVDPMGWHTSTVEWEDHAALQDMVLTISQSGDLEFWMPKTQNDESSGGAPHLGESWARTGLVHSGKSSVVLARCSARKKTALVNQVLSTQELSIWDSQFTEFSTGLEHSKTYSDPITDLDWTTTPDLQSILAIGFSDRIELCCEKRMDYVTMESAWETLYVISVSHLTPHPISDSIWLADGSFAVGAYNGLFIFRPGNAPEEGGSKTDLFQEVVRRNGPLLDYHPQNLAQCLLWNKEDVVREIFQRLLKAIDDAVEDKPVRFSPLTAADYWATDTQRVATQNKPSKSDRYESRYGSLFETRLLDEVEGALTDAEMARLASAVSKLSLTKEEGERMLLLAGIFSKVEELRRSLDINGLRYFTSLRLFAAWQRELTKQSDGAIAEQMLYHGRHDHRDRLAFRNIVWATHSDSQEVLLQATTEVCPQSRMLWRDARHYGVFMWLRSRESIIALTDTIARNEFLGSDRDPTSCSLFYFALGRKSVVHGLWRQSGGHPEQQAMLRFLANDFTQPRWKTAALKNAYALLSKQRYAYAAAFFLLGDSPKDAINVCVRQLQDLQLATAIAMIQDDSSTLLKDLITRHVLPLALSGGHRWLAHWSLWMQGKQDLAGEALLVPFGELNALCGYPVDTVGEPENDDPSLALLVHHLRTRGNIPLVTVSGHTEFQFVLHNAQIFRRMGCHKLALALLREWTFIRPRIEPLKRLSVSLTTSPNGKRMKMDDGEISNETAPPATPAPKKVTGTGMGMQSDASQGNVEFDMGAFF